METNTLLCKILNNYLERLVHPEVHILNRSLSSFKVLGYSGLALAILLTMTLVTYQSLFPWVMVGLILSAVLTFFGLAMVTKIITGEERLIYYHHEIAVMIVTTVLLWLLRQPILPYLDVTILGVGLFLACGRVGCLMVGCCHGWPHRWGVCYRKKHADAGFTPYYIGVRLFPIQALELLWVFGIVLVGSVLVLNGRPSGEALSWYVVTYGVGRFCFEFVRGDSERSYLWGYSEAQWVSLFLMCAVVWAELSGVLTVHLWHAGATACLVLTMIAVALRRHFQRTAKYQLLHPHHVKEVAEAVELVSNLAVERVATSKEKLAPSDVQIGHTSLGIQVSASKIKNVTGCIYHYALSHRNGNITEEAAKTLAGLILQLRHPSGSNKLIIGNRGVFHLLIHPLTSENVASPG